MSERATERARERIIYLLERERERKKEREREREREKLARGQLVLAGSRRVDARRPMICCGIGGQRFSPNAFA
jgi:hypothetical protein